MVENLVSTWLLWFDVFFLVVQASFGAVKPCCSINPTVKMTRRSFNKAIQRKNDIQTLLMIIHALPRLYDLRVISITFSLITFLSNANKVLLFTADLDNPNNLINKSHKVVIGSSFKYALKHIWGLGLYCMIYLSECPLGYNRMARICTFISSNMAS